MCGPASKAFIEAGDEATKLRSSQVFVSALIATAFASAYLVRIA